MKGKKGFTLVEIMIVVAIIGLLAAIAIPSFVTARANARAKACVNNLRLIDASKEQAAMENNWASGADCNATTGAANYALCLPYLKGGLEPVCPSAGAYDFTTIGVNPTCSIGGAHDLPGA